MSRFESPGRRNNTTRIWFVLLIGLGLTACGFRLAGSAELPPQLASIYLVTSDLNNSQLRQLRRSLNNAGASLVEQPDSKAVQLIVSLKVIPDRQLATSSSSGAIVERISRSLSFNVNAADGKILLEPQTLHQQRDVSLDDDNLLSSDREKESVARDLEQALFDQLIRQLVLI